MTDPVWDRILEQAIAAGEIWPQLTPTQQHLWDTITARVERGEPVRLVMISNPRQGHSFYEQAQRIYRKAIEDGNENPPIVFTPWYDNDDPPSHDS